MTASWAERAPAVLGAPLPPPEERRRAGRARRADVPRRAHAGWESPAGRADPVEVLVESCRSRVPELVPIRFRRMLASPFTFFRGAALVMAHDLAACPTSGLAVQLCGDAHLANFGVFASPERTLVFDLNDFDETWPGPFDWDVRRLVTSVVLAAQDNGFTAGAAATAARAAAAAYRTWMDRYAAMTQLEVWYARLDAEELRDLMAPSHRRTAQQVLDKAGGRNHHGALSKLTELVDGRRRIVPDPPIVTRVEGFAPDALAAMVEGYRATLATERQELFDRYRLVDLARKVVGVGSVGTRCWIALFQGPNGGPLFLQVKEAGVAAPAAAGWPGPAVHQGQRVVDGQRRLQAASDVLLGWTTNPIDGVEYYVRQLWDAKGSADVATMSPGGLATYAAGCGWALARAHARCGDAAAIAGYLGRSDTFVDAVVAFGFAYAEQTVRDHAALRAAADHGRVPVAAEG